MDLPREIWVYIFQYCDFSIHDLAKLSFVNKGFRRISSHDYLWSKHSRHAEKDSFGSDQNFKPFNHIKWNDRILSLSELEGDGNYGNMKNRIVQNKTFIRNRKMAALESGNFRIIQ